MKAFLVLVLLFCSHSFAESNTAKSCEVIHPQGLVWGAPAQYSWSGGCISGKAHGYGWYKFSLANDGYANSTVELLTEFKNGVEQNNYYYVKMLTDDAVTFEGYAQFGGFQVDEKSCLQSPACAQVQDVVKNGVRPPLPPAPPAPPADPNPEVPETPETPEEPEDGDDWEYGRYKKGKNCLGQADNSGEQGGGDLSDLKAEFPHAVRRATECLFHLVDTEHDGSSYKKQTILDSMNQFSNYFPVYVRHICQRNRVVQYTCEEDQYSMALNVLGYVYYYGYSVTELLKNYHDNYRPLGEQCENASSNGEFNNCWGAQIQKLVNFIAKNHPNGAKNGSVAFDALASALAHATAGGGSAYTADYLDLYEHLMWFVLDVSKTNY
ncbi:hypothetical protein [Bdellovibrio reynosensis]|uniref:Uncharacterized protein n=1 Tax=Bdellovibrio reynosensis TaxID=2835041 RepID=A0ABY4CCG4_9BACT|nr:hypothetical protein [Bdellovibrio reynosensis]UOF02663.1 hypothetical protein MNR06_06835 [Bdellovibrio reynosensis]